MRDSFLVSVVASKTAAGKQQKREGKCDTVKTVVESRHSQCPGPQVEAVVVMKESEK